MAIFLKRYSCKIYKNKLTSSVKNLQRIFVRLTLYFFFIPLFSPTNINIKWNYLVLLSQYLNKLILNNLSLKISKNFINFLGFLRDKKIRFIFVSSNKYSDEAGNTASESSFSLI